MKSEAGLTAAVIWSFMAFLQEKVECLAPVSHTWLTQHPPHPCHLSLFYLLLCLMCYCLSYSKSNHRVHWEYTAGKNLGLAEKRCGPLEAAVNTLICRNKNW